MLVLIDICDIHPEFCFRILSFRFHSLTIRAIALTGGIVILADSFWKDQQGSTPKSNWFKEHPRTTLVLLISATLALVLISI